MGAILFNAAVLFMAHGSKAHNDGNGGAEGLKTAAQSFKKAAGLWLVREELVIERVSNF